MQALAGCDPVPFIDALLFGSIRRDAFDNSYLVMSGKLPVFWEFDIRLPQDGFRAQRNSRNGRMGVCGEGEKYAHLAPAQFAKHAQVVDDLLKVT